MRPNLFSLAAMAWLAAAPVPAAGTSARPNVVLIVIDDLGYGDLGCYGSTRHKTPHIDALAAGGMRFTDFHTNGPVCSPTRAALMTGQYQQRSGIENAIGFTMDEGVPLARTTLAEILGGADYRCGVFGKWHLGHVTRFGPNDQGFHESVCSNNSPDYHSHISRDGNLDWWKNQAPLDQPGYLTDLVQRETIDFITRHRDRPFFAFMSHLAVHFPFQGPADPAHRTRGRKWDDDKYGPLPKGEFPRAYRDMLEAVDRSVGAVVATLQELGLLERTLIFVTSDNGGYSWVGSNGPLRGQKTDLYEGGHRVAAIANWPGRIPSGVVSDATVMTMDIAPTVMALAGAPNEMGVRFDGRDVSGVLLRGERVPDRTLYWRFGKKKAVRRGSWKLVVAEAGPELFDLEKDLGETADVAAAHPGLVRELSDRWAEWEADVAPKQTTKSL